MSRVLLVVAAVAMVAVGSFAQAGPLVCPQDTATAFPAVEVAYTYVYVHFVDAWGDEYVVGPYYSLSLAASVRNNLRALGYSAWLST